MTINEIIDLPLYPRHLISNITEWLESDHIILITGSRQVGKTSVLYLLVQWLVKQNFPRRHLHYFDLEDFEHYFDEYLRFGGYPAGALEQNYERKMVLLNEIYQTYVRKDINQLFTIENVTAFNNQVRLLGFQIGQLVNLKELATSTSSGWRTIEN